MQKGINSIIQQAYEEVDFFNTIIMDCSTRPWMMTAYDEYYGTAGFLRQPIFSRARREHDNVLCDEQIS